jgi:glucan phosphorylase
MAKADPRTLAEWRSYVDALDGEQLIEQARSANSASFVRQLQEEGSSASDVHAVLILFAQRIKATGLRPPDGFYDYFELMKQQLPDGA